MSKVALITGAAQGIGKAIATRLAKDGFKIAITDLKTNSLKGESVIKEIENKYNTKGIFIPADSRIKKDIHNAVETTYNELGGFNVIINNAGIAILGKLNTLTSESWDQMSSTNINGTLYGIQIASEKFQKLGQVGKIINAGSTAGIEGYEDLGGYCMTKHAIRSITQTSAKELAPYGITVNSYCPGITNTELWKSIDKMTGDYSGKSREAIISKITEKIPLGRTTSVEDVSGVVSFLASEDSNYLTGQSIIISGGSVVR
ncbi:3-oxoacyl-[acyl-carrier-protein] reductase [Wickerhamomyces ciferrii]|uniref:3-oxoacyl-[acyl-carrier-protein] reductase n=1 Tax=Wickerhamomyces ciferrii (strain ATCC 14091 / BCRC 22168 / CBS 111 / JCM 3599 / NBRC 0793 / NRRL Y-1031 F-60-10) TaxID=1206466 RepID=K0KG16_WICCF|nr:3-oxoacyl-[acyl-carrier-protein] reductase [Wickerhamomyces ciferrii]CCH41876.1 3-oxoacyl-[acyl-carrier-protein] reductase [Wickerhamomyces ciferrii]